MGIRSLASWQWSDYHAAHADRRNLLIHIVAVPLFLLGNVMAVALPILVAASVFALDGALGGVAARAWWLPVFAALPGFAITAAAIGVQGAGHKREAQPPHPFTGPGNAVARILVEQWFTFPRFVATGGWRAALRAASK